MFAGLGVEERNICVFPSWMYPASSPCSEKHNVEESWVVDTTSAQRQWWEQEEQIEKKKAVDVEWAEMFSPIRTGAFIIAGALAIGIYMSVSRQQIKIRTYA